MTTFSQLTDELILEVNRPELVSQVAGFVNQTVRELHADRQSGVAISFWSNLVEVLLAANVETAYIYMLPQAHLFQRVEAVYYPQVGRYADMRRPSSAYAFSGEIGADRFWYRSGDTLAFSGYGGIGAQIKLAYFSYPQRLTYFANALNPCKWSDVTQAFTYLPAYDVDATTRASAQALCSNWLIARYGELIRQGVRAKLYMRLGDVERARLHFSLYENMRPALISAETFDTSATYAR